MDVAQVTMDVNNEYGLTVFQENFLAPSDQKLKYLSFSYIWTFVKELEKKRAGLGTTLIEIFLTAQFPENWQSIKAEILRVGGFIGPVLCENPGSFRFMDLLYRYKKPEGPLDKYLMNCQSGRAVNHRKAATIKHVSSILAQMQNGQGRKKVLNLGSGCGYDTLEMAAGNGIIDSGTSIINVDIDPAAVAQGNNLFRDKYSHLTSISFVKNNMLTLKIRDVVMALIIGILCSYPHEVCVRNLRIVKSFLLPGSIVYGACVTDRMLQEDLFTAFVLEYLLGWHLCYRKAEKVEKMFTDAGYIWRPDLTFVENPTRFYVIGAGEFPSKV